MKTTKDFMTECINYFGGFINKTVSDKVYALMNYVKPTDLERVFQSLIETVPANWKPDYKAVNEAIKISKIELLSVPGRIIICPVCDNKNYTNGCCPICKYDSNDGDPVEYRKFWEDWKAGKIEHVDVQEIITKLTEAKE